MIEWFWTISQATEPLNDFKIIHLINDLTTIVHLINDLGIDFNSLTNMINDLAIWLTNRSTIPLFD